MTSPKLLSAARNARFFPDDHLWQRHCAMLVAYLEAVAVSKQEKVQ